MVETLAYKIIRKLGKVEIRLYREIIVARVQGMADGGFSILFGFISGNNRQKKKVEMTSPVISEKIEMTSPVLSDKDSIAFVMPEEYKVETVPEPVDERVKIHRIPGRHVAALRFSGRWSDSAFSDRSSELLEELATANIRMRGNVFAMRYDAPFTPWFRRRNEVAIEVEIQ